MSENVYTERPKSRIFYPGFDDSDHETEKSYHHSFSRYATPNSKDNWSYASTVAAGSYRHSLPNDNKYSRRSLNKKYNKRERARARPKPLQYENEKYYDHVFPKRDGRMSVENFYQPSSLDHAEL